MGRAIRRHRHELSQQQLADRLGVCQASISSWEQGNVDLTCEQVAGIEACLGLRRGALFIEAGYVGEQSLGVDGARLLALGRLDLAIATLSRDALDDASSSREEG